MSPEVTLLVRAALLGLGLLAAERLFKRRQDKRRAAGQTIIRLSAPSITAPEPLAGRPVQVTVRARPNTASATPEILRLEPAPPVNPAGAPKLYDGHVTEKRAA